MASGFGAGAGADMLQQILVQKFREQQAIEQARHAQQQIEMQSRGQDIQLRGQDQAQGRYDTSRTDQQRTYDEEAPMRAATLRHIDAQTGDLQGRPAMSEAAREAAAVAAQQGRDFTAGQNDLNRANAMRVATLRAAQPHSEPVVRIQTVDADGNPVIKVMSRSAAAGQEFAAAPTTDQRNRQAATGRSSSVIKAIADLSERINTGQGAIAKIQGAAEKAKASANLNDDVSEYQAVVSGFTPLLARAVGHTGVLTEQDVQSVRKMLPDPGDSKSVRDRKIARIESLMSQMAGPGQSGSTAKPSAADLIKRYGGQ